MKLSAMKRVTSWSTLPAENWPPASKSTAIGMMPGLLTTKSKDTGASFP